MVYLEDALFAPIHDGDALMLDIRTMEAADRDEIARLIFHSTNQYYQSIGRSPIFQGNELDPGFIFDVYQELDPGCGLVAIDRNTIVGSCFVHPRRTHHSLGIMNVHPDHFGKGAARALLGQIIQSATHEGKPVRLVSSCLNLDSYSLYTKAGFVPFATYQDMFVNVPETGLPPLSEATRVRLATHDDLDAILHLEKKVSNIERRQDYQFLSTSRTIFGAWQCWNQKNIPVSWMVFLHLAGRR